MNKASENIEPARLSAATVADGSELWVLLAELQATRRRVQSLAAAVGQHLDEQERAQLVEATHHGAAALAGLERITRRAAGRTTEQAAGVLEALERNGAELTDAQRRAVVDSLAGA